MTQDLPDFVRHYETHVGHVASGDTAAALADMAAGVVPAVFAGIDVPSDVTGARVVDARTDGSDAVGEAVYQTATGAIGLRSFWSLQDGAWRAHRLENFAPDAA